MKTESSRAQFEKELKHFAPYHHRYKVWDDLITCYAIALSNGIKMDDELERKYLDIINRYERADQLQFGKLAGLLTMAFEESNFRDLLGEMYMSMGIGSTELGQFFTPYEISKLMAELTLDKNMIETKKIITMHEPACGSGGMVVAQADIMASHGYNPQKQLLAHCIDVDQTAAMMCYIQLALWGIPAKVTIGNTLTMNFSRTMFTPMYHLGGWHFKEMCGQEYLNPAEGLVSHAKTIIKHGSQIDTEEARAVLLHQLNSGVSHNAFRIIDNVSRITVNDDVYDLLRA